MIDSPLVTAAILGLFMWLGLWSARRLGLNFKPPKGIKLPVGEVWLLGWMVLGYLGILGWALLWQL